MEDPLQKTGPWVAVTAVRTDSEPGAVHDVRFRTDDLRGGKRVRGKGVPTGEAEPYVSQALNKNKRGQCK